MRIGNGYDVHAFTEGDHLMIGGVAIPHTKAFLAHSDGDVLLHAISDALLGAAALGDIGRHFPDTDPQYKGIDSRLLLQQVVEQLAQRGMHCVSVDATIMIVASTLPQCIPRWASCSPTCCRSKRLSMPFTALLTAPCKRRYH